MTVTKHYEQDHVILYVEEDGKKNCITLKSDEQMHRLGMCLCDLYRTEGRTVRVEKRRQTHDS